MRKLLALLVAASMPVLWAPAAAAQDVMVDPDSPAGAEYDIPLDSARESGAKKDRRKERARDRLEGKPSEPFGEGIEPESQTGGTDPGATAEGSTSGAATEGSSTGSDDAAADARAKRERAERRRKRRAAERRAAERRAAEEARARTTETTPEVDQRPSPDRAELVRAADADSGGAGDTAMFTVLGLAVVGTGALGGYLLRRRRNT